VIIPLLPKFSSFSLSAKLGFSLNGARTLVNTRGTLHRGISPGKRALWIPARRVSGRPLVLAPLASYFTRTTRQKPFTLRALISLVRLAQFPASTLLDPKAITRVIKRSLSTRLSANCSANPLISRLYLFRENVRRAFHSKHVSPIQNLLSDLISESRSDQRSRSENYTELLDTKICGDERRSSRFSGCVKASSMFLVAGFRLKTRRIRVIPARQSSSLSSFLLRSRFVMFWRFFRQTFSAQ